MLKPPREGEQGEKQQENRPEAPFSLTRRAAAQVRNAPAKARNPLAS